MAYLLGQLGLQADVRKGLDNLKTAAVIADQLQDTDLAAPLYVCEFGLCPSSGLMVSQITPIYVCDADMVHASYQGL